VTSVATPKFERENIMPSVRTLAFAVLAAASLAFPARAEVSDFAPTTVYMVYPDGRVVSGQLSQKASEMAMSHAKQIGEPVMVVISKGKAYMVTGLMEKMADGKPMVEYFNTHWEGWPGG
jgi:Mg-chelatase subunit ChlD